MDTSERITVNTTMPKSVRDSADKMAKILTEEKSIKYSRSDVIVTALNLLAKKVL